MAALVITACHHSKSEKPTLAQLAQADTSKPDVKIKVNKQYDDKGNLIRYDSAYSYIYSSPGMRFDKSISPDSVYGIFGNPFFNIYRSLLDTNMNSIFFNDSLYKYDFFNRDYFSRRFQLNMKRFENMFRQMDSLKQDRIQQDYPEGKIKKK